MQDFQRDGKYSYGENVATANMFHHVGKPVLIAQNYELHMKPRLK